MKAHATGAHAISYKFFGKASSRQIRVIRLSQDFSVWTVYFVLEQSWKIPNLQLKLKNRVPYNETTY